MDLSDATEKIPATPEIDPEAFRIVAQCLNHYATPGPGGRREWPKFGALSWNLSIATVEDDVIAIKIFNLRTSE